MSPSAGLVVDTSRMGPVSARGLDAAFEAMAELEAGAVANADEGRQVGHYWLRAPELAPAAHAEAIRQMQADVLAFADGIRKAGRFDSVLQVGIGGSALGPQLLCDALDTDRTVAFLDNTDPDGIARTLATLDPARTLVLVVSKSGGTKETRNAMLEARRWIDEAGLTWPEHAVAVTGEGSQLDRLARDEGWMATFPMWDFVGGRTSVTAAVGLLPAALAGLDVEGLLAGARSMDAITRTPGPDNPAAKLAASWRAVGQGRGHRAMVVLPYKDRLVLLSRYLQQLVMESLGKRLDRQGRLVHQGLTVYGNKGSTDQHAYVQQLRDGRDDFFALFVAVLEDGGQNVEVEPGVTTGDYLLGFLLGTRRALSEAGRPSTTLVLDRVDAPTLGAVIALFERAVGLYAELVDLNAYHQPGVEAGKKAAAEVLELQARILAGEPIEDSDDAALLRRHLAANGRL